MARHAQGWTVRLPAGRTVYLVRFQHNGRTVERSTGERDHGKASEAAARIYAEVTLGFVGLLAPAGGPVKSDLAELFAHWLAAYEMSHAPDTTKVVEGYAHGFVEYFRGLERFTEAGFAGYMRDRIRAVTRVTLRKELSALRGFCGWLAEERSVRLPAVPSLPKAGHAGTRARNARKRQATILTRQEMVRILRALPRTSPHTQAPVRAFVIVCAETSLRPYATVARLEAPLHYHRGRGTLFISREIDKIGFEREVPLTKGARAALDAVCPEEGRLFGKITEDTIRHALKAAVRAAGVAKAVSIYDLRHSRLSALANAGGPLTGVQYLAGHKHLSTTAVYVRASQDAARQVLILGAETGALGQVGVGKPEKKADVR